jgi:hypothetical protein
LENNTPETRLPSCPSWTLIEPCAWRRSLILGESWKTFGRCSWPHRIRRELINNAVGRFAWVHFGAVSGRPSRRAASQGCQFRTFGSAPVTRVNRLPEVILSSNRWSDLRFAPACRAASPSVRSPARRSKLPSRTISASGRANSYSRSIRSPTRLRSIRPRRGLFPAGNRASLIRRSTMRRSRSIRMRATAILVLWDGRLPLFCHYRAGCSARGSRSYQGSVWLMSQSAANRSRAEIPW